VAIVPAARISIRGGRATTPYEQHRDYVLAVLARRCGWLDPSDREALFHDAYAVLLEKQRNGHLDFDAMRTPQIRAYLTQTALNKAMDEGKRAGRRLSVSLDDERLGFDPADSARELDEQLASRLDDARIREIVAELPERQQLVIKLRFFFNRTPQEIGRFLGVTDRVYRRELERATRHIAERFELVRQGTFCESRRSLILAYVAGIAGPSRRKEAQRHIESCPACRHTAAQLSAEMRRAAALVPPPTLALGAGHFVLERSASAVHAVRQRIADLTLGARARAVHLVARTDPSKTVAFSNVRPSAAALAVAGCLAAGSTATYCVVHGLPAPIRSLIATGAAPHRRPVIAGGPSATAVKAPASRERTVAAPALLAPPARLAPPAGHAPAAHVGAEGSSASQRGSARLSRRAKARQVHIATSTEFGVGAGSPVGTIATSTPLRPMHAASATQPARPNAAPAPPPKPSTNLPEFDP
jgi:RNA polymerase sigma factor (sigma-70 family)